MAHRQGALVGYAHPFDADVDPVKDPLLTSELPVDAALDKLDYYEAVGFSDHTATNAVWYRLLECGLQIPAGAGTDAMANYASLRGPVGLNRVYVPAAGELTREAFLAALKHGRTVATNGPLLQLKVGDAGPGDTIRMVEPRALQYRAMLQANFPIDHLELLWNGTVAARLDPAPDRRSADVRGEFHVGGSGWLLLRAWNDGPDPNVLDIYPYATTSPVYVRLGNQPRRSHDAATYFLRWLDRIRAATEANSNYRTDAERAAVLQDVTRAAVVFEQCKSEGPAANR
jgi:TolB protein